MMAFSAAAAAAAFISSLKCLVYALHLGLQGQVSSSVILKQQLLQLLLYYTIMYTVCWCCLSVCLVPCVSHAYVV